jgi:hypothetical protein
LIQQHLAACAALAEAAQANASAQSEAADQLRSALASSDMAATHAAVDRMWAAYHSMYQSLQASLLAWNALAPVAEDG